MEPLPCEVVQLYTKHYAIHSQPSLNEFQHLFLAIAQRLDSVFFVLDGLDECALDQRAVLCKFFAEIVGCRTGKSHGAIKLFVTSRKELDIEREFQRKSFPMIEVEAARLDSNIRLYVEAQIQQHLDDGSLILNDPMLKNKIITTLTTKAGGMYVFPLHCLYLDNDS